MNRNTNIWYAGYVTFEPCERVILSDRDHDAQVLIILWTKEIKLCFQILHKIDFIKNIVDIKAFKMEYLKKKRERDHESEREQGKMYGRVWKEEGKGKITLLYIISKAKEK